MTTRGGEPRLASAASWLVLVASFGLSAATWIALAELAGFGGTVVGLFRLAWLMPAVVDGYIIVALAVWMSPRASAEIARFARRNTYAAAGVGVAAQSAYHALIVLSTTGVWWRFALALVVGALPPAVSALAVHMRALVRRQTTAQLPPPLPEVPQVSAPIAPEPLPAPAPEPAAPDDAAGKGRKTPAASVPKRPFALTQQAAASMEAGGMTVPQIAVALGISERQVRNALRPVEIGRDVTAGNVSAAE